MNPKTKHKLNDLSIWVAFIGGGGIFIAQFFSSKISTILMLIQFSAFCCIIGYAFISGTGMILKCKNKIRAIIDHI
jgi:hypothetical protein